MSFLTKIFGRKVETKSVSPNEDNASSFVGFLQDQDEWDLSFAMLIMYSQRCAPFGDAVNILADAVCDIEPRVWDWQKREYDDKHPLNELLRQPNDTMDRANFFRHLVGMFAITSNPFIRTIGPINRPPLSLDVDSPVFADVQPDKVGDIGTIKIQNEFGMRTYKAETVEGRRRYRFGTDNEIWPCLYFNPNRGTRKFFATPIAKPLYYDIEQYITSGLHNKSLLKRGARPGGMFSSSTDVPLTDEQFERLQNQVNMYFAGAANAGRPMIGENIKFEPMITSNRDMDYATLVKNARTQIYSQFRIPLPIVNSDSQTYSNYETAQVALYDRAALPMARFLYGQLGNALLYRYGRDWRRYEIRYDETDIPALQMRRAENVRLRKQIGVNTVNELRQQLGDDPVDGGDVILRPANEIPALDGATDAPPQPTDK
jgi:HK97 family phage portal protein